MVLIVRLLKIFLAHLVCAAVRGNPHIHARLGIGSDLDALALDTKNVGKFELLPSARINSMFLTIGLLQPLKACFSLSRLASASFMTADMYSSM